MMLVPPQAHRESRGLSRNSSAYLSSSSNTLTKLACALITCKARKDQAERMDQADTVARTVQRIPVRLISSMPFRKPHPCCPLWSYLRSPALLLLWTRMPFVETI